MKKKTQTHKQTEKIKEIEQREFKSKRNHTNTKRSPDTTGFRGGSVWFFFLGLSGFIKSKECEFRKITGREMFL